MIHIDISLVESKTKSMPCCLESIGTTACMEMKRRRPTEFEERCRNDADFGMIQCCLTCETEVSVGATTLLMFEFRNWEKSFSRPAKKVDIASIATTRSSACSFYTRLSFSIYFEMF